MTRLLNKLTARKANTLKEAGRHSDGGGLYLSISTNGGRRWVFLHRQAGKPTELGLGSARSVSLAEARQRAADCRKALAEGRDPRKLRERPDQTNFGQCADDYIQTMRIKWKNDKHAQQWEMTLTKYAAPLRGLPLADVDTAALLKVLKPLWERVPETAERLRGRIEKVLDAAKAKGLRTGDNPARWRGHLEQLLPKRQRLSRGHHKALPFIDAPEFMKALRLSRALAARALEFTILTAVRSDEAYGARWEEFDLENACWTVAAERTKAKREHRVPLSPKAVRIIRELEAAKISPFVFPGRKPNKPLSNMAMSNVLERMKVSVTVHGFRSTFRDWASECTEFSNETCEAALAHVIGDKAEAAYRRGDRFAKRRELMNAWEAFCIPKNDEAKQETGAIFANSTEVGPAA